MLFLPKIHHNWQFLLTFIDLKKSFLFNSFFRLKKTKYVLLFLFKSIVSISGGAPDDSSSEENQTNTHKITNIKPIVPPRPRAIAPIDFKRNGVPSNGIQSNKNTDASKADCKFHWFSLYLFAVSIGELQTFWTPLLNVYFPFFVKFPVTSQLLTNIITQLKTTTNSVMQLHQRLKNTDETSSASDKNQEMLKELENAVMMTQSMLTNITTSRWVRARRNWLLDQILFIIFFLLFSASATTKSPQENGEYTQMMDKCTNILQQVQKHVQHNNNNNNDLWNWNSFLCP